MNKANNARSQKTRKAIRESLLVLLESHPVLELDVSMICQRAEINRSTFYDHYGSIPEVLNEIAKSYDAELLQSFAQSDSEASVGARFSMLAGQVQKTPAFFRAWLNHPDITPQMQFLTEQIVSPIIRGKTAPEYRTAYYECGILAIIRLWLNSGCMQTVEEITDIFLRTFQKSTVIQ